MKHSHSIKAMSMFNSWRDSLAHLSLTAGLCLSGVGCDPSPAPQNSAQPSPPPMGGVSAPLGAVPSSGGGGAEPGGVEGGVEGGEGGGGALEPTRALTLAPARLARLTRAELLATLEATFGQAPEAERFEAESSLHGFVRVASGETTVSPLFAEQLEASAWELTGLVTERAEQRLGLLGCDPVSERERGAEPLSACVQSALFRIGGSLWRRPLSADELDELTSLFDQLLAETESPLIALRGCLSALIQSPHTLFRVELGEPHPSPPPHAPERLRYTSLEMASRLSYLLWSAPPDEELMRAALAGQLTEDGPLRAQVERMMASPKTRAQLTSFFDELLGLERLALVSKDPSLFPELNLELLSDMRAELHRLFEAVVLSEGARFDELFVTDRTFVTEALASLYELELPASANPRELTELRLDPSQGRGGLLARAALMTLLSHSTQTSPTLRGRLIRSKLLCQDVPPPPEGVVTELPSPREGVVQTLRERLNAHISDPQCAGCHLMMDPLGFPLEGFDPIGRARVTDNGLPLDLSGDLDGQPLNGARELGEQVADSELLGRCVARRLYRYAGAHLELPGELPLLDALGEAFNGPLERQLPALLIELIMSEGFREASPPEGAPAQEVDCDPERCDGLDNDCDGRADEGLTRACESQCGAGGVERCLGAEGWSSCLAPDPPQELCNGVDEDCDGAIDEGISTQELCNQLDDDCDGRVDEDSASRPHPVRYELLSAYHEGCSLTGLRFGGPCNAAINRLCQAEGCGGTGFGPCEASTGELYVICTPEELLSRRSVSYERLASHHEVCNGSSESAGPNCNAAIHRYCAAEGLNTGFGPLEHSPTEASITCVPSAQVVVSTYTELNAFNPLCSASAQRIGPACHDAIHQRCVSGGFRSGWGPLENSGDTAVIACLP